MKLLKKKNSNIDMLHGSPIKSIILFALPIFFGSIFQQLYSMVDSIVVGNYVGAGALAAVGSSATVCNCLIMACSGFTTGASVVVAQQFGAGKKGDIKATLSTTFIFLSLFSILLSIVSQPIAPVLARLINVPDEIFDDSVTYMRVYWAGMVFLMLYNFFAAVLRALGDSITPLIFLIVSSVLNIFGDLYFVLNLDMGVAGVAWATVLSQAVSVILCSVYVSFKSEYFKFQKGEFVFSKKLFSYVLQMGIPAALQGSVSNLGFIMVQSLVNSFSTLNIAAYTAANKMEGFSMLPIHGVTQAFAIYVGQNMGAGDVERTKKGMRQTALFLSGLSIACSALIYAIGPILIGMFVDASEVEVISRGTAYLRAFCPFLIFHALMQVFVSVLRGAGDGVMAMVSSFFDLGMRMLAAYALSLWIGIGFMGCAYAIPIGWFCSTVMALLRYRSGKWQDMAVVSKNH